MGTRQGRAHEKMVEISKSRRHLNSIQAEPKRSRKNSTSELQRKTLRKAFRNGMAWEDDEVARIVAGIERDESTFEMALATGRTYYGTMGVRAKVGFALRHAAVLGIST